MENIEDLSLLIIAFKRVDALSEILKNSLEAGIRRIYVVVDLAPTPEGQEEQNLIFNLLEEYRESLDLLKVHKRQKNVGCAISVLTGLDWVFSQEEFVCVLEADCIPSLDFFRYVMESRRFLAVESDILLVCGTQFAPEGLTRGLWVKSSYSLTWGWATTREKWNQIRADFFEFEMTSPKIFKLRDYFRLRTVERIYWNSGARRALEGFVDVWDTVLVRNLQLNKQLALLPPLSLVKNVGSDSYATHTKVSKWTNLPLGKYQSNLTEPVLNKEVDDWLRKNFFNIRVRHLLSTKVTALRDRIFATEDESLLKRWVVNQIIES